MIKKPRNKVDNGEETTSVGFHQRIWQKKRSEEKKPIYKALTESEV